MSNTEKTTIADVALGLDKETIPVKEVKEVKEAKEVKEVKKVDEPIKEIVGEKIKDTTVEELAENNKKLAEYDNLVKKNAELEKKLAEIKTAEKVVGEQKAKQVSKYIPGFYRAEKFLRIIKKLSYQHSKDSAGKVQKTYGTWATSSNMIEFKKGLETSLTEEDLELPAVQRLIDTKVIYRVG